ncbi:MAG: CRISPR-associated helicase/endonuclease Cas3 [Promethearchaeota archaeon]
MAERDARLFWGKLGGGDRAGTCHPLACHMLDAGAVAAELSNRLLPSRLHGEFERVAKAALGEGAGRSALGLLVALHDLGKATPAFQAKNDGFDALPVPRSLVLKGFRHAGATTHLLKREVWKGGSAGVRKEVAHALGGHHGAFPAPANPKSRALGLEKKDWVSARSALLRAVRKLVKKAAPQRPAGEDLAPGDWLDPTRPAFRGKLMALAGFVVLCDWLASMERHFPMAGSDVKLDEYAAQLPGRARAALDAVGFRDVPAPVGDLDLAQLYEWDSLTPVQAAAADLLAAGRLDPSRPGIVVLEAPTGSGKTEAGYLLADAWNASGLARGLYIAMPTMATSKGAYRRLVDYLRRRFGSGDVLQATLNFSQADLWEGYGELLRGERGGRAGTAGDGGAEREGGEGAAPPGAGDQSVPSNVEEGEDGERATVEASQWFLGRRRGLLAPYGAGTVDQALLSVVQVRFHFLRFAGLAAGAVLFDEVHAYDAYTSTLIERLLEWLAAAGTPVVLLSATLTAAKRNALVAAYARGAGAGEEAARIRERGVGAGPTEYPRATWWQPGGTGGCEHFGGGRSRRVALERFGEWDAGALARCVADEVEKAGGGFVAVVCNTVGAAQEVHEKLAETLKARGRDGGVELLLFHSRFRTAERNALEDRVLQLFGRDGPADRRGQTAVLVATQVVEQSLDLDFDLLVTELAPVDLLFQRVGRLHRHAGRTRPGPLSDPRVLLVGPAPPGRLPDDQEPKFHRHPYHKHLLLRAWWALGDRDSLDVPADVEPLVEAAYRDAGAPGDASPAVEEAWRRTREKYAKRMEKLNAEARTRAVSSPADEEGPFTRRSQHLKEEEDDAAGMEKKFAALTRFGPPTARVVLLTEREAEELEPANEPGGAGVRRERVRQLLSRAVIVSHPDLVRALANEENEERFRPGWWRRNAHLRGAFLLVGERGVVGGHEYSYDATTGLKVQRTNDV